MLSRLPGRRICWAVQGIESRIQIIRSNPYLQSGSQGCFQVDHPHDLKWEALLFQMFKTLGFEEDRCEEWLFSSSGSLVFCSNTCPGRGAGRGWVEQECRCWCGGGQAGPRKQQGPHWSPLQQRGSGSGHDSRLILQPGGWTSLLSINPSSGLNAGLSGTLTVPLSLSSCHQCDRLLSFWIYKVYPEWWLKSSFITGHDHVWVCKLSCIFWLNKLFQPTFVTSVIPFLEHSLAC